jgi:hypothetical protein
VTREIVPRVVPTLVEAGLSVVHLQRRDQGLAEIYRRAVAAQADATVGGAA